jgi:uncharacterized protein (TIGR03435 family)
LLTGSGVLLLTVVVVVEAVALRPHEQSNQSSDQKVLKFDVASVKPNTSGDDSVARIPSPGGVTITNATLQMMMRWAYRVQDFQIIDGPSWLSTARFDVVGKAERTVSEEVLLRSMLRALLVDRFMLVVHNETRELPVYALVAARSDGKFGPQLRTPSDCVNSHQPASPQTTQRASGPPRCDNRVLPGNMSSRGVTMPALAVSLSVFVGRTVIDRTGFAGTIDYDLRWTPDRMLRSPADGVAAGPERPDGPSLFTALQEQLGLKLEATKGAVNVVVIDHVEKPTLD